MALKRPKDHSSSTNEGPVSQINHRMYHEAAEEMGPCKTRLRKGRCFRDAYWPCYQISLALRRFHHGLICSLFDVLILVFSLLLAPDRVHWKLQHKLEFA